MFVEARPQFGMILEHLADSLDIPRELRQIVVERYLDIAGFLSAEDSLLHSASPDLYPQGSFSLDTVVRPIHAEDDYDIDMVCLLHLKKESVTQEELKDRIGLRLRQRADLKQILTPSRRCWRLDFPEGFHMDVLPAIPDLDALACRKSILITDTELRLWQHSNPKGFTAWFRKVMEVAIRREKQLLVEASHYRMSIEEIPDEDVKTPLQRSVQILKRHRDVYFEGDPDLRPVSVILTTLAAHAYADEDNLFDALLAIIHRMPEYLERRNGRWWVENPVNPLENFADKWNEYPERREAFIGWLDRVEEDFDRVLHLRGAAVFEELKPVLGERLVINAVKKMGGDIATRSSAGGLRMIPKTGNILSSSVAAAPAISIPRHTFYGRIPKIKAR